MALSANRALRAKAWDALVAEEANATARWYERARWWLAAGVAALAVVAVALDLPTGASRRDRQSGFTSWMATLEHDVARCSGGIHDALVVHFSPRVGLAGTYTDQAISACAFTDSGIVDLGGEQPPADASSPAAERIAPAATKWADADAVSFLRDLLVVISSPGDSSAERALLVDGARLDRERAVVEGLVASAEKGLGLPEKTLALVKVAPLLEGGR
ncbi:MAG: hypothetical protein M0005_02410 [Actinomycetota bacterium]|nr:hypothetical protein [Actinomycetota bacterium]